LGGKVVEDLKDSDEDLKVPRSFYVHISSEHSNHFIQTKTDVPMVYNWHQLK